MNMQQKPFDNPKVREALNYAINKEALVKVAFAGYAVPAEGVVPPGVDYATKTGPWKYDPAKARELLKEAGYPNGFETTLWSGYNHTTAQKIIQFVQQQLAQVGVKASVEALEAGSACSASTARPIPRRLPCACTTSAGLRRRAKRTGPSRRCFPVHRFRRSSRIPRTTRTKTSMPTCRRRSPPPTATKSRALCGCAKAHLGRRAVDFSRDGEGRVRAQQASFRRVCDAGRLVQFRRDRHQVKTRDA